MSKSCDSPKESTVTEAGESIAFLFKLLLLFFLMGTEMTGRGPAHNIPKPDQ